MKSEDSKERGGREVNMTEIHCMRFLKNHYKYIFLNKEESRIWVQEEDDSDKVK